MPDPLSNKTSLVASFALVTTVLALIGLSDQWRQNQDKVEQGNSSYPARQQQFSLPKLASFLKLKSDSTASDQTLNRSRTNFLLASNLIKQNKGQEALEQLQGLEQDYPLLAPYILLKQGQAYELAQANNQAEQTWQKLLKQYPDSPAVVEALYLLGKKNSAYWEQAIAKFPDHPRTHQIVRQLLEENPNQPRLMMLLVKYAPDEQGVDQIRDRLVQEYASQLTSTDWQAIADGYWQQWQYEKAGKAYAQAPRTPRNLYRAGRGLHLGDNKTAAKSYYQQLLRTYPHASETGLGLRRLASISKRKEALNYLDLVVRKFPEQAPQALLEQAKLLETLDSPDSATQARQLVLTDYASSEAAAEYRWRTAWQKAQAGDLANAWRWAQPITVNNPDSPLAPKASFWVGKWAKQLNRPQAAQTAFESVLARYPQSYYAWRAAVALGWNVGDFTSVRDHLPAVTTSTTPMLPPAGSAVFHELYQLGLETKAWMQFQAEISNKDSLTVAEEFTYGLMQQYQGKYLRGINKIWYLKNRTDPQDKEQWQALRQSPQYWQALFPFPFEASIRKWASQRKLNPLLVTALIRQESRFEPEIRSWAGAVGLMQIMPGTGEWVAEQIQLPNYALENPEDNIKLGTYYLDYTHRRYDNNSLLAVASYNAGPNNVAKWLNRYGMSDPDLFVEQIPFPETKGYVEAVFENYWNYLQIYSPEVAQLFEQISS